LNHSIHKPLQLRIFNCYLTLYFVINNVPHSQHI